MWRRSGPFTRIRRMCIALVMLGVYVFQIEQEADWAHELGS